MPRRPRGPRRRESSRCEAGETRNGSTGNEPRAGASAPQGFVEEQPELLALLAYSLLQLGQLPLERAQAVGEVKRGEHGNAQRIGGSGTVGDGIHELVDAVGQLLHLALVAGGTQGIVLPEDGDLNALPVVHGGPASRRRAYR